VLESSGAGSPGVGFTAPNIDGIRAAARQLLHGPSLPRRWFTVRRLPRTGNGKIARGVVGDAARRAVAGDGPPAGGPQLRPLP